MKKISHYLQKFLFWPSLCFATACTQKQTSHITSFLPTLGKNLFISKFFSSPVAHLDN